MTMLITALLSDSISSLGFVSVASWVKITPLTNASRRNIGIETGSSLLKFTTIFFYLFALVSSVVRQIEINERTQMQHGYKPSVMVREI